MPLNPERQAALDAKVNTEVERQVAAMIERIESSIEKRIDAAVEKRIDALLQPKLEKLNGSIDDRIEKKFHSWFWQTFKRHFARLNWRIHDTHDRLTTAREWVKRLEQFEAENPAPDPVEFEREPGNGFQRPYTLMPSTEETYRRVFKRLDNEIERQKKMGFARIVIT